MVAVIVAALLLGVGYLLCRRLKANHAAEVTALLKVPATSERDREMAPYHVQRFTRAIEQCVKPERLEELQNNLRYWQAVAAAEEMRP